MPNKKTNKPNNNSTATTNVRKNVTNSNIRTKEKMTTAPMAMTRQVKTNKPVIKQKENHTIVRHKEFLSDIVATNAAFSATRYPVNPALFSSFPWLSSIANQYESYIFEKLNYVYEPICPTTTPGTVMMAIDYDASDTTAANKVTLMSYSSAVRSSPWEPVVFSAKGSDLKKFGIQRYTRNGVVAANNDIKTYDVGSFQIATQSTPSTSTALGELYVEYEVKLFTPQLQNSVQPSQRSSQKTKIVWDGLAIPTLTAIISGISEFPLSWIYKNNGGTLDLIINTIGDYLLHIESNITATPTVMPPNIKSSRQSASSSLYRILNIADGYFADVTSNVRTKVITNVGFGGNGTFAYDYTVIRVPCEQGKNMTMNLIPIDRATATGLAAGSFWDLATSGSDFPDIVLDPPKLLVSNARSDVEGIEYIQVVPPTDE